MYSASVVTSWPTVPWRGPTTTGPIIMTPFYQIRDSRVGGKWNDPEVYLLAGKVFTFCLQDVIVSLSAEW